MSEQKAVGPRCITYMTAPSRYTHNRRGIASRRGIALCSVFKKVAGTAHSTNSLYCPMDRNLTHQCGSLQLHADGSRRNRARARDKGKENVKAGSLEVPRHLGRSAAGEALQVIGAKRGMPRRTSPVALRGAAPDGVVRGLGLAQEGGRHSRER